MQDTPSQRLVAMAQVAPIVTDATGRTIALRRLTALDKLRLYKAAGPVLAQNQPWLGLAVLAASVVELDHIPVPVPTTEAQIEHIIQRLGDEGISAIAAALVPEAPLDSDAAKN